MILVEYLAMVKELESSIEHSGLNKEMMRICIEEGKKIFIDDVGHIKQDMFDNFNDNSTSKLIQYVVGSRVVLSLKLITSDGTTSYIDITDVLIGK